MTYQTTNDFNLTRQDGTYTGATGELVVSDGGTITLPTPTAGEKFGVRALRNDVTLLPNGSIEASTSDRRIDSEGNSVFVSDGTEWYLVSGNEYFGFDIPDSVLTQDLVAWYRFEDGDGRDYASASEFPSINWGDSTSYDASSLNSVDFKPTAGVVDFKNGANSGAFEYLNAEASIDVTNFNLSSDTITVMHWAEDEDATSNRIALVASRSTDSTRIESLYSDGENRAIWESANGSFDEIRTSNSGTGYFHQALVFDNGNVELYVDAVSQGTGSIATSTLTLDEIGLGNRQPSKGSDRDDSLRALQDDVRIYNAALTQTEISDIYNATEP